MNNAKTVYDRNKKLFDNGVISRKDFEDFELAYNQAKQDLVDIWGYIAKNNISAADHVLDQIDATCYKLADSPGIGRLREDLSADLRSLAVGNYVIFYQRLDDNVVVIRVLHGARNIQQIFAEKDQPPT